MNDPVTAMFPVRFAPRPPRRTRPEEAVAIDDRRAEKGAPPKPGQVATLCFHTENGLGPVWPFEYVEVEVAEVRPGGYCGVVVGGVLASLIPPGRLRTGSAVVFTPDQIFGLADDGDPAP